MVVDTNIILRYLICDNNDQFIQAQSIIEGDTSITLSGVVIFETLFVLQRDYKKTKKQSSMTMRKFIDRENVTCEQSVLELALDLYGDSSLDYVDCYSIALAITKKLPLKTFDKKMQKVYEQELANC